MNSDIEARVNAVFRAVFDDSELTIAADTTADDVENWDSLTHIDLIVAMEKEFKVRFTTAEVTGLKNVGELMGIISRKLR